MHPLVCRTTGWLLGLSCAVACFSPHARGQAPAESPSPAHPIQLTWSAPSECPDQRWILSRVHVPRAAAARLAAHAQVTRRADGYHLDLVTDDGHDRGRRRLTASDCQELAEVTAALLSLAISSAPSQTSSSAPEEPPVKKTVHAPPRRSWRASGGARIAAGVLPWPSAGPSLALGWTSGLLRAELGAFALLPVTVPSGPEVSSRYWMMSSTLSVCLLGGRAWKFGGCLATDLGAMSAEGRGVTDPRSAIQAWLAPQLALHGELEWDRFSIALRPSVGMAAVRPRFSIEPYGELYQPPPVFGALDVSFGVSF